MWMGSSIQNNYLTYKLIVYSICISINVRFKKNGKGIKFICIVSFVL